MVVHGYTSSMRVLVTILYVLGFVTETGAAAMITLGIRSDGSERDSARDDARRAPLMTALSGAAGGIIHRFAAEAAVQEERVRHQNRVVRLTASIRRQWWALGFIISGAVFATAGNVVALWRLR